MEHAPERLLFHGPGRVFGSPFQSGGNELRTTRGKKTTRLDCITIAGESKFRASLAPSHALARTRGVGTFNTALAPRARAERPKFANREMGASI